MIRSGCPKNHLCCILVLFHVLLRYLYLFNHIQMQMFFLVWRICLFCMIKNVVADLQRFKVPCHFNIYFHLTQIVLTGLQQFCMTPALEETMRPVTHQPCHVISSILLVMQGFEALCKNDYAAANQTLLKGFLSSII